ncbi:MAG TPA: adenylyl-sulfate kinase [Burkholderiales bacterium]|nr:adenylyl-sulfate kinase [Burkholderiales bacterium]
MTTLIAPYGGTLINLMSVNPEALQQEALRLPSLDLNPETTADLELLMSGAYSPLTGFMGRADYESVLHRQTLCNGTYWPLPVVFEIPAEKVELCKTAGTVALRDAEGLLLALMSVEEIWEADALAEAELLGVAARADTRHYLGGRVQGVAYVPRHDFPELRVTPAAVRSELVGRGLSRVIALQTRQPLTRAQYEFLIQTTALHNASLLLHPMITATDSLTSADFFALVRGFQAVMPRFPKKMAMLAILALPPRMASARELGLRSIVARNFGVGKLIVGGTYQAEGHRRRGQDAAQLADELRFKTGVELLLFPRMVYAPDADRYIDEDQASSDVHTRSVTGEEMDHHLRSGLPVAPWHVFPEVLNELLRSYPPRSRMGLTVFFTGLSGSGKSTLARALASKLMEIGNRPVTLLDGDVVRKHLSSELGFSPEHRDINIRRIGYVASEITKHRGIAICAPIAPYAQSRLDVRAMVSAQGGFVEIYVATPLEVCEGRDRKGLYARARAGLVKSFTGISDPYEVPKHPELVIDTTSISVEEGIERIVALLRKEGYLPDPQHAQELASEKLKTAAGHGVKHEAS